MREFAALRINHPSPLIYWKNTIGYDRAAENQSSIPFDILRVGHEDVPPR